MMYSSVAWGVEPEEQTLNYPCDSYCDDSYYAYYRGITIEAEASTVFRWLCQLRVAPYSYDWIDNLGRRSPRELTPGMDEVAVGQTVMTDMEIISYERDCHLTIRGKEGGPTTRAFGDIVLTYLIVPQGDKDCRLLMKLLIRYRSGLLGWMTRMFLPWGDLIMMRKQLKTFKELAETRCKL